MGKTLLEELKELSQEHEREKNASAEDMKKKLIWTAKESALRKYCKMSAIMYGGWSYMAILPIFASISDVYYRIKVDDLIKFAMQEELGAVIKHEHMVELSWPKLYIADGYTGLTLLEELDCLSQEHDNMQKEENAKETRKKLNWIAKETVLRKSCKMSAIINGGWSYTAILPISVNAFGMGNYNIQEGDLTRFAVQEELKLDIKSEYEVELHW